MRKQRVDLSDITVLVGKCKQRDHYEPWNVGNDPRLKPSIVESESVGKHALCVLGPAVPSEVLETAERCLRDCSLVRSCKSDIKF
jgi:hypothetical protein